MYMTTFRFSKPLFLSCLDVSLKRTASHLRPSSSLRSSSNRTPSFKHLAFFCMMSGDISKKLSFSYSFFAAAASPLFFCVVVVMVVLIVEVVVVVVCLPCASVARCSLARHRMRSRMYRVLLQMCLLYDHSLSYHLRVVTVLRITFCRPMIHVSNYLLSYCLVPVELEGSTGFGCDHDHALY